MRGLPILVHDKQTRGEKSLVGTAALQEHSNASHCSLTKAAPGPVAVLRETPSPLASYSLPRSCEFTETPTSFALFLSVTLLKGQQVPEAE